MPNRLLAGACLMAACSARAATLTVGPGQTYHTIAAAVAAARNGDTVLVQSGTYTNDFPDIVTHITLRATGGRVTMRATGNIANEEGILRAEADALVDGFTFTGARVSRAAGENGAGLRYIAGNLRVENCWFTHNQNGLFANPSAGTIAIRNSQFDHNGDKAGPGEGHTHNLYVDAVARLDVENSFFTHAIEGHEIKSRALVTVIRNSRVSDGPGSTASYSIDFPNGGQATLTNLQIEQGPDSTNGIIIAYGEEGGLQAGSFLSVRTTLIENDLAAVQPVGVWNASGSPVTLTDLRVFGLTAGELVSGTASVTGTKFLTREPHISDKHPFGARCDHSNEPFF